MLTDNKQIFRNSFLIIHRHLTKVSAQIIQCIIFYAMNSLSHYLLYGLTSLKAG